jgi:hypothetical protein
MARTIYGTAGQTAQNVSSNPTIASNSAAVALSSAQSESSLNPNEIHDSGRGQGLFGHNADRLAAMQQFAGVPVTGKPGVPIPANVQASFYVREMSKAADNDPFIARVLADPNATAEDLTRVQMRMERPQGYKGPGTEEQGLGWAKRLANTRAAMGGNAAAIPQTATMAQPQPAAAVQPQPAAVAQPQPQLSAYQSLNPANVREALARTVETGAPAAAPLIQAAPNYAPAALGTAGAMIGGAAAGPPGAAIGATTGGALGGLAKNYFTGTPETQTPVGYTKEALIGAPKGAMAAIGGGGVVPTLGRMALGAGTSGLESWMKDNEAGQVAWDTGLGLVGSAGGELFGRGLGMAGHQLWDALGMNGKTTLLAAGKILSEQQPKVLDATGKMVENKVYTGAAEAVKRLHQDPEAVAYNYAQTQKVLNEGGIPKTMGEVLPQRPGAVAAAKAGQQYDAIRAKVNAAAVPPAAPFSSKFNDGPASLVGKPGVPNTQVFKDAAATAETQMSQKANTWGQVFDNQIKARTGLLTKEREAMEMAPGPGKDEATKAYRAMADQVRLQQERIVAKLLPPDQSKDLMDKLRQTDFEYQRALKAGGNDLPKVIAQGGDKAREARSAFDAIVGNDVGAKRMLDSLTKLHQTAARRALRGGGQAAVLGSAAALAHFVPGVGTLAGAGIGFVQGYKILQELLINHGAGGAATFNQLAKNYVTKRQLGRYGRMGAVAGSQALSALDAVIGQ